MELGARALFVRIRIFRIGGIYRISRAPILRFSPQVARALFVRIRIFRIGGVFRISLAHLAFFAAIGNPAIRIRTSAFRSKTRAGRIL